MDCADFFGIGQPNRSPHTNTQKQAKSSHFDTSLTRTGPGPSSQVVENKNTTGMNEPREAQNRGKYPENMA